jgi:hypothetical protein
MIFVKKCLRVKDKNHPLNTRCKNNAEVNGILCKNCLMEAHINTISVLMNNAITEMYKIPFKNQMCIDIFLNNGKLSKPESKLACSKAINDVKVNLREKIYKLGMNKMKDMHDSLKINIWDKMISDGKSEYAIQYKVCEEIINRLCAISDGAYSI